MFTSFAMNQNEAFEEERLRLQRRFKFCECKHSLVHNWLRILMFDGVSPRDQPFPHHQLVRHITRSSESSRYNLKIGSRQYIRSWP